MAPITVDTDTTLLQNPNLVGFIAKQPTNTVVYVPGKATQIAETILNVVGDPRKKATIAQFGPYVAIKSLGQAHTLRAIFDAGFGADVASLQEARFALWAGSGLITPADVSFTNLWVGEKDIHKLVSLGVHRFTVDKQKTVEWIAEAARAQGVDPSDLRITLRLRLEDTPDQGAKFGIPPSGARDLAVYATRELGLTVIGIAFHIGTTNSAINMDPERHGLDLPVPEKDLFDNYAEALKAAAPVRNALFAEGLIGPVVNTEGGLRPPYHDEEYDYRAVLRSMAGAFKEYFTSTVRWMIEPGRLFAPSAIGKFTIQNVDEEKRVDGPRFAATELSLYVGGHDFQWDPPLVLRETDILAGKIYTHRSHPEQFGEYRLAGAACAGSDEFGFRKGYKDHPRILLPRDLQPGEVVYMLPFGAYTAAAMGPQAGLMMDGRHQPGDPYYGFNGIQWPNVVAYEPGCPTTGAPFPVEPVR